MRRKNLVLDPVLPPAPYRDTGARNDKDNDTLILP